MDTLDTNIRQMALGLLEELSEEEQSALYAVCDAVRAQLAALLRRGVTPEDCAQSFTVAAAVNAAAVYRATARRGIDSFQAGTVSVSLDRADADAQQALARRLLAPWMDDGPAFLGV